MLVVTVKARLGPWASQEDLLGVNEACLFHSPSTQQKPLEPTVMQVLVKLVSSR
jgi:hypothetical protein